MSVCALSAWLSLCAVSLCATSWCATSECAASAWAPVSIPLRICGRRSAAISATWRSPQAPAQSAHATNRWTLAASRVTTTGALYVLHTAPSVLRSGMAAEAFNTLDGEARHAQHVPPIFLNFQGATIQCIQIGDDQRLPQNTLANRLRDVGIGGDATAIPNGYSLGDRLAPSAKANLDHAYPVDFLRQNVLAQRIDNCLSAAGRGNLTGSSKDRSRHIMEFFWTARDTVEHGDLIPHTPGVCGRNLIRPKLGGPRPYRSITGPEFSIRMLMKLPYRLAVQNPANLLREFVRVQRL